MRKLFSLNTEPLADEGLFELCRKDLSDQRNARLHRMQNARAKRLCLGAGLLLDAALREYGFRERTAPIRRGLFGKPYLAGDTGIHFNLSHSGEKVICALSDHPVGADVQQVEPEPRLRLARRFFLPGEVDYIRSHPDRTAQAAAFFRLWALKESVLKFTGQGLHLLTEFEFQLDDRPVLRRGRLSDRLQFWEDASPDYQIALCSDRPFDGLELIPLRVAADGSLDHAG